MFAWCQIDLEEVGGALVVLVDQGTGGGLVVELVLGVAVAGHPAVWG